MIRRLRGRRNGKRPPSSKRRAELLKRLHVTEQLEVRAAPGSMIVDALALGGYPVAMAQLASEPAQEPQHPTADGELASAKGTARVAQPSTTCDAEKPLESVAEIARGERPSHPAVSDYRAATWQDSRVGRPETKPEWPTDKRSARAFPDAWFSDASILVGTGLDDGLDAQGAENSSRLVDRDRGANRAPSSYDSGTSPGQLPDLPEGSDMGTGNPSRDRAPSRGDSHSGYSDRETPDSGGSLRQMALAERAASLGNSRSAAGPLPASTSSTQSTAITSHADSFPSPGSSRAPSGTRPSQTVNLGFANRLTGWNIQELGGSPQGKGTVTEGSAILREGNSFLVTLDQDLIIPQAPLSLSFTYEATFDTSDPDSVKDAFEAVLMAADGSPLVYNYAPERDAYFNLTEQMPRALGTGTTEETVADGKRVSTDISQIPPGTAATLMFRLANNDADVDTTIHILSVQLTSGEDAPPTVTAGLTHDTAPDGPGSDPYRSDLLTNDPRVSGTATDDHGITRLEVQTDGGPLVDITAALINGQYSFDPGNLSPGPHLLKVRATDVLSQASESEIAFTVNTPPVAAAGGNRTVNEGDTLTLNGSGSSDTEAALFRYQWGFDDGSFVTNLVSSRTYPQDGTFPVSLTVTDTAGSVAVDRIEVAVNNTAPIVLTATDLTGAAGARLDFTATFSDPGVFDTHSARVHWGDGATSAGTVSENKGQGTVSASHVYALGNTYTIRVEVTDDAGDASDRLSTAAIAAGQTSSLAGYVYLDVNNNAIKDPPEKPLPNVPVTLSGIVSSTVVTAADGSYRFDNLPPGTYAVREAQPRAFLDGRDVQGSPRSGTVANDAFLDIELPAATHATGYNFGELGLRGVDRQTHVSGLHAHGRAIDRADDGGGGALVCFPVQ